MNGIEWARLGTRNLLLEPYILAQGWGLEAIDAIERGDVWKAEFAATKAAHFALNTGHRREEE